MDPSPHDLRVLLIEDNDEHAAIISRHLRHVEAKSIHLSRASCLADGLAQLTSDRFDALLLDLQLPDSDIDDTLERTLPHALQLPIIVLSTLEERVLATRALKEGAQADIKAIGDRQGRDSLALLLCDGNIRSPSRSVEH